MWSFGQWFLVEIWEKVVVLEVAEPSEPGSVDKFVDEEEQNEEKGLEDDMISTSAYTLVARKRETLPLGKPQ